MARIELLSPAGDLERLKVTLSYGADAVYIGGEAFGLRAKAKNFSMEEMAEGIAFAHQHGVKVFRLTVRRKVNHGCLCGNTVTIGTVALEQRLCRTYIRLHEAVLVNA